MSCSGVSHRYREIIYTYLGLNIKAFLIFRCSSSSKFHLQTLQASVCVFLLELWPLNTLWTEEFAFLRKKSSKHSSYLVHLQLSKVKSLPVLPDLSFLLATLIVAFYILSRVATIKVIPPLLDLKLHRNVILNSIYSVLLVSNKLLLFSFCFLKAEPPFSSHFFGLIFYFRNITFKNVRSFIYSGALQTPKKGLPC